MYTLSILSRLSSAFFTRQSIPDNIAAFDNCTCLISLEEKYSLFSSKSLLDEEISYIFSAVLEIFLGQESLIICLALESEI